MALKFESWKPRDSAMPRGTAKLADIDEKPYPDMHAVLEDWLCDKCAGKITVGDYVCWGVCFMCFDSEMRKSLLENAK